MNQKSRRNFIKGATAAAVVGPNIIIKTPGIAAPSERLTLGFIGVGGRGFNNLDGLKGHRSVGGCRASIYNAFPREGVERLVSFMEEFERNNG